MGDEKNEFHNLKGVHLIALVVSLLLAAHLVRFLRNLKRVEPKKEVFDHSLTGQYMAQRPSSLRVTGDSVTNNEGMASLHAAVLGAFYNQLKGGAIVSCGKNYMMAIEFDGPLRDGGVYGEMVYVDKNASAQAFVRKRNCKRAAELGKIFLTGETIQYIDTTSESDFFHLLSKYKKISSSTGLIDVKSGLYMYRVKISK